MKIKFKHIRDTKGKQVFQECDDSCKELDYHDCMIGALYIGKNSPVGVSNPTMIEIEVKVVK